MWFLLGQLGGCRWNEPFWPRWAALSRRRPAGPAEAGTVLGTGDRALCSLPVGRRSATRAGSPSGPRLERRFDHPSLYHGQVLLITRLFGLFDAPSLSQSAAFGTCWFPTSHPEGFSSPLDFGRWFVRVWAVAVSLTPLPLLVGSDPGGSLISPLLSFSSAPAVLRD